MQEHDRNLSQAFDRQAERFATGPIQSDPAALERLVRFADLPLDARVLDAGCGPGLVGAALLRAGHRVVGVDLSSEMIARARRRCAEFGDRAVLEQASVFDPSLAGPFDAAVSRFVLHHVSDPAAFIRRQSELLRPGGVLVVCDHTTDPEPARARWHQEIERGRDRTHTRNLTSGEMVDLLAAHDFAELQLTEESFSLDFDEWFDRGSPAVDKETVRGRLREAPPCRGFTVTPRPNNAFRIDCRLATVRGMKPDHLEK